MRRKLRNGKGARAGICPGAGEIAGALRQSRAAKLAGARNDRGAPVELRVDSSHHQYSKEVSQVCGRSRHQLPVCSLQALSARWCSRSPGSPHLAENIMDAVDWSIGRLSPPIAVNRVHAIATAPANYSINSTTSAM
ncbi:BZ3500_MvSof-1268-A1-R1_C046g00144 [Microbotryum saponariae]|uniref:BZ3500_MvSof-1268-A1-R1_C046g00144 protein n=1 Tax=Microbotryum saponariae TaxID=289078 RepID=A0A2X0LR34_9BASI|nr:BZ3500_MvSof-1268-A1-R1_C046g00144 [Microbotryum saponariae]SDA01663.1 BZ3501_MvSof-1269-A2-R1_Chr8-2g09790 [Microbotryum saponariae]